MGVFRIFKNRLFQCCLLVCAVCILILHYGIGDNTTAAVVINYVLEINGFAMSYAAYVTYLKK